MKEVDWKLVASNDKISKEYAIEVKNRFDALSQPSKDSETIYNNLIVCTEEVALSTLKKKKVTQSPLSAHTLVKCARKAVYAAKKLNEDKPSKMALKNIGKAQKQLDEAYASADTEYIQGKINNISRQHTAHQHATAWSTINELTGRKSKPSIRLKGGSAERRKDNWLSHFTSLLGETPNTTSDQQLKKIQIS